MLFSSGTFIFYFLPLVLLLYYTVFLKFPRGRNVLLLVFSLLFYAWGEPKFVLVMIGSIIVNYIFGLLIGKWHKKLWVVLMLIFNLGLLFVFKYLTYTLGLLGVKVVEIALPIGISFFTFQAISYVLDVYLKKADVQRNPLHLGLYISFFPQLIAGPIVRYDTFASQITCRKHSVEKFSDGIVRFCMGLGKKVLIANNMAVVADSIFARGGSEYGLIGAWVGIFAYTMQIYFDFSGYSDMAIGMGRMMGFHFLENFNYPYISKSVTEFWRRWHMSLSSFFRDYVYIPLGGNRCSVKRHILNILIVWMLTGLWHGAAWNFILWGVYYGVLLLIEKYLIGKYIEKIPAFFQHLYTIIAFVFGWALFRAESMLQLKEILGSMIGLNGAGSIGFFVFTQVLTAKNFIAAVAAIIFSMPVAVLLKRKLEKTKLGAFVVDLSVMVILFACILSLEVGSYNPFIYFRF